MREIRLYGSEGGGAERLFLPLWIDDKAKPQRGGRRFLFASLQMRIKKVHRKLK
jgi:hypothetical protein